jgi:membrane protein YqaA with SNARE-associated domain
MKTKLVKVYLCNVNTLGAMCGYGVGRTREAAIASAMQRVRAEYGVEGWYENGQVYFRGGVNC